MSVEDVRILLKVHIKAAEAVGKMAAALALLAALDAIDAQITAELSAGSTPESAEEQEHAYA